MSVAEQTGPAEQTEQFVRAATPAAASGPEHVTEPTAYDAILLASFGGPEGQDDVIPFLRNVTRGRGIPDERLEEVAHHYRHFGGVSPINDQNRELKAALEAELERRGIDLPVLWGNRAYSSYSSCRQYREDYAQALADTGLDGVIQIDKVRQFFDHPGFVTPFIEALAGGLAEVDAAGIPREQTHVLFTTHSIPSTDAAKSGPASRGFGEGGAYAAQHLAVAEVVVTAQEAEAPLNWSLVYQSRSGPPTQPWLEPDINDAIDDLAAAGIRAVVIVPLGFVSDHMEVKWDLDTEAMETSAKHGILAVRVPTPGVHAAYVSGLIDLVIERRDALPVEQRPSLTALGPWYDVCRPGCCENVRLGFKPTVAGLQP